MTYQREIPNKALLRELEQVHDDAISLISGISGHNRLPDTFPSNRIIAYATALSELKNGTAQGCVEPLMFFARELPRIRRRHIYDRKTADEIESMQNQDIDTPPLRRGELIDTYLQSLFNTVNTALDEYREQKNRELISAVVDPNEVETSLPKLSEEEKRDLNKSTFSLDMAHRTVKKAFREADKEGQVFVRTISDYKTIANLGKVVLSSTTTVKSWFEALTTSIVLYPKIIRAIGTCLKTIDTTVKPVFRGINKAESDAIDFAFDQVQKFATVFDDIAENHEIIIKERRNIKHKNIEEKLIKFETLLGLAFHREISYSPGVNFVEFKSRVSKELNVNPDHFAKTLLSSGSLHEYFSVHDEYHIFGEKNNIILIRSFDLLTQEESMRKYALDWCETLIRRYSANKAAMYRLENRFRKIHPKFSFILLKKNKKNIGQAQYEYSDEFVQLLESDSRFIIGLESEGMVLTDREPTLLVALSDVL